MYGMCAANVLTNKGSNMRMERIQGAVLSVDLKYLGEWTEKEDK